MQSSASAAYLIGCDQGLRLTQLKNHAVFQHEDLAETAAVRSRVVLLVDTTGLSSQCVDDVMLDRGAGAAASMKD